MSHEIYANIKYGIYNLTQKQEMLESSFLKESIAERPNSETLECLLKKLSVINASIEHLQYLKKCMDIKLALLEGE